MLSFSVAIDPNKGIGINGVMPWHIKEEFKVFRANTMGKHLIMGKTTYVNLPGKLPNRIMMVVTTDKQFKDDDAIVINDLKQFCIDHQYDETEYVIAGGSSIYRQAYPYLSKGYVSFIKKEYEVDSYLDCFHISDWIITKEVDHEEFIERELKRK